MAMLVIGSVAVPGLETVIVFTALLAPTLVDGKTRLAGENAILATPVPVPAKAAVWIVPATLPALSVMLNVAARLPTAVGSKVTEIVQLAAATIDEYRFAEQ